MSLSVCRLEQQIKLLVEKKGQGIALPVQR